jgi:hypothetical protein
MFGHKAENKQDKDEPWRESLRGEFERLDSLSLAQLSAEIMDAAFAPGCAGADDDRSMSVGGQGGGTLHRGPSAYLITNLLLATREVDFPYGPMKDFALQESIAQLVAEALQELEHASLLRPRIHDDSADYALTRRGRAVLERGEVAATISSSG